MKFFALIQYYFAFIGIDAYHAKQKQLLNKRSVTALTVIGLSIISKMIFLICKAQSLLEYTESLYVVSTVIGIALVFIIVLCEMPEIFEVMNDYELIVNERK